MAFTVNEIIDGNTIRVDGWKLEKNGETYRGKKVKIQGYSIPENFNQVAVGILKTLILNKEVELRRVIDVEKGISEGDDTILCSVFLNGVNISQYFSDLQIQSKKTT